MYLSTEDLLKEAGLPLTGPYDHEDITNLFNHLAARHNQEVFAILADNMQKEQKLELADNLVKATVNFLDAAERAPESLGIYLAPLRQKLQKCDFSAKAQAEKESAEPSGKRRGWGPRGK